MTNRIFNFSAGPATLPLEVLEKAQAEFLNFNNTGMSIMEMSHRSKPYEAVHNEAIATISKATSKGVYHKNNCARKVARLSKAVNSIA